VIGNVDAGQWQYFRLDGNPGNTFVLSLDSQSPLQLYASRAVPPTLSQSDFTADQAGELRILNPTDDTYYIGVYAPQHATGSNAFTIDAQLASFGIRQVTPNIIGNTGTATVKIEGDNFDSDAQAQLIAPDETVIEADEYWQDPSTLFATFDLAAVNVAPGQYDLCVINADASQTTRADAVTVEPGDEPEFLADLHMPGMTRPGRVITLTIEYTNPTNIDIPSPIVTLDAGDSEFQWQLPGYDSWVADTDFRFLALSSDGPATVLRPGQTDTIELRARTPLQPGSFTITVLSMGATSTDGSQEQIDWAGFEADVRP